MKHTKNFGITQEGILKWLRDDYQIDIPPEALVSHRSAHHDVDLKEEGDGS